MTPVSCLFGYSEQHQYTRSECNYGDYECHVDFYCSQAIVWNCKLGLMSPVSFFSTDLTESKELTTFQLKYFWQFDQETWTIFGGSWQQLTG
jgi:hypothetical protein